MIVLGISPMDCESAVSVVVDGRCVWVMSEERVSRVKQQDGFPGMALRHAMKDVGFSASDVEASRIHS